MFLCTPALADYNFAGWPVETRTNGTVKWARLYTGIWAVTETHEGWVNVTFNGVYDSNSLGLIHLQGKKDNNSNVVVVENTGCGMMYQI